MSSKIEESTAAAEAALRQLSQDLKDAGQLQCAEEIDEIIQEMRFSARQAFKRKGGREV